MKEVFLCFECELSVCSHVGWLFTDEGQKRVSSDVFDTFATATHACVIPLPQPHLPVWYLYHSHRCLFDTFASATRACLIPLPQPPMPVWYLCHSHTCMPALFMVSLVQTAAGHKMTALTLQSQSYWFFCLLVIVIVFSLQATLSLCLALFDVQKIQLQKFVSVMCKYTQTCKCGFFNNRMRNWVKYCPVLVLFIPFQSVGPMGLLQFCSTWTALKVSPWWKHQKTGRWFSSCHHQPPLIVVN